MPSRSPSPESDPSPVKGPEAEPTTPAADPNTTTANEPVAPSPASEKTGGATNADMCVASVDEHGTPQLRDSATPPATNQPAGEHEEQAPTNEHTPIGNGGAEAPPPVARGKSPSTPPPRVAFASSTSPAASPAVASAAPPPAEPSAEAAATAYHKEDGSGSDVDDLGKSADAADSIDTKADITLDRIGAYSAKRARRSVKLSIARAISAMDQVGAGSGVEFTLITRLAESITIPRIVALVICWLQVFAVSLPTVIISAQHRDSVVENVRTLCLVIAGALTIIAATSLKNVHDGPANQCFEFLTLKMFSFMFEVQLFAVAASWPTLFIFGIFSGIATIVAWVAVLFAFLKLRHSDPGYTELQYTRYAASRHVNATVAMVKALRRYAQSRGNLANFTQEEADSTLMVEAHRLAKVAAATEKHNLEKKLKQELVATSGDPSVSPTDGSNNAAAAAAQGNPLLGSMEASVNAGTTEDQEFRKTISNVNKGTGLTERMARWYSANRIRKALFARDSKGNRVMSALLVVLFVASLGTVAYEFAKIFANQPPLFSASLNAKYKDSARTRASFGATRSHTAWKVHIVVVDGMRYDMTDPGASAMGDLVASPAFAANSVRLEMRAQLPSFSVPNWMTLLSGAPPEQTGVTGNLLSTESSYDHLYRECEEYNLHAGLTGTPWWRNLIFSTVPTLDGDGTIWSDYVPAGTPSYAWDTANPGDEARLQVALTAAARAGLVSPFGAAGTQRLYELFLTHFSDVDKQGHELGVSTDFNTQDTYLGAIANATAAIQQIISAIDSQTVLIITSDHGHVQRGGHGGLSEALLKVPVIFYTKNAALTASTPLAFPSTAGPRFGTYENTDFVATVTALLGVPAPRQTTGIFMEEVVRSLVPGSALLRHYDDLMRARYSLVEQTIDHIGASFWGNLSADTELEDPAVLRLMRMPTPVGTEQEYGDAIRMLDTHYNRLRDNLALFDLMRNLIASIFMFFPGMLFIVAVVEQYTVASLSSVFDANAACRAANIAACVKGFVTMFLHIALSLAIFLIGYFGVTHYTVWDSTLTHTPSVATTFLSRTVIAPVFVFVFLTRAFLFTSIRWYSLASIREFKEIFLSGEEGSTDADGEQPHTTTQHRMKFTHLVLLGWMSNFIRDIIVLCFGTSRYKRAKFADAYLYLYYVAMWSAIAAFLLLFMCFPFSFMIPVVFAIPYVSEFNAEWRFRMITMLMLVLPLLAGTALMLFLRPPLTASTVMLWDEALLGLDLADEIARLRRRSAELLEALNKDPSEEETRRIAMERNEIRGRMKLAARAAGLLMDSGYAFTEDSLAESELLRDDAKRMQQSFTVTESFAVLQGAEDEEN